MAWSWLLYLCMPLRPTRCSVGKRLCQLVADRLDVGLVARRRRPDRPSSGARRSRRRRRPRRPGRSWRAPSWRARSAPRRTRSTARRPRSRSIRGRGRRASASGTISGDQDRKFWMRPTFTLGLVDVDPVVGEQVGLVDDQRHGEEVAVAQLVGARPCRPASAMDAADQLADRRRGDDVLRRERLRVRPSAVTRRCVQRLRVGRPSAGSRAACPCGSGRRAPAPGAPPRPTSCRGPCADTGRSRSGS